MKKYKKSFPLRKCKNFFNIRARKLHFLKYKELFSECIFFIFLGLGLESVPGGPQNHYLGSNVKPTTKELDEYSDLGFNEDVFNYIQFSNYEKKYQQEKKVPSFVTEIPRELTEISRFIPFLLPVLTLHFETGSIEYKAKKTTMKQMIERFDTKLTIATLNKALSKSSSEL